MIETGQGMCPDLVGEAKSLSAFHRIVRTLTQLGRFV
jgi:hypothetical protein